MTLAKETMSSNQAWAGIYTIADANLPQNPGTYSVVISAGDSQNSFALIGNVIELTGVQQSGMVEATACLKAPRNNGWSSAMMIVVV